MPIGTRFDLNQEITTAKNDPNTSFQQDPGQQASYSKSEPPIKPQNHFGYYLEQYPFVTVECGWAIGKVFSKLYIFKNNATNETSKT